MVLQLVQHERIETTTVSKAKEIPRFADKMVQLGGFTCCGKASSCIVLSEEMMSFTSLSLNWLIDTVIPFPNRDRAGGYTRMLRTRIRVGNAAPLAYIEFIDRDNELRQSKPATPQPPQRVSLDPWERSLLTKKFAPPKEVKSSDSEL